MNFLRNFYGFLLLSVGCTKFCFSFPHTEVSFSIQNNVLKNTHMSATTSIPQLEEISSYTSHYAIAEINYQRVRTPFAINTWILISCILKILFFMTPKLSKFFPESCMLIINGLLIGLLLKFGLELGITPFTPTIFFLYILPPIIFDAGYFMPNRMFFDNLGTILVMAVVGTIFNIFAIGFTLWGLGLTGLYGSEDETPDLPTTLLFTTVIAATDPVAVLAVFEELHVNELLYIIVFGESLLNDAVTVVIYHMMEVYNEIGIENVISQDIVNGVISFFVVSMGGTIIGIIWGFITGFLTRFTSKVLIVEPLFVFITAYLSYLNAEMFHMSGILAIAFCGITMKNYVESNVTENSRTTIQHTLKMLSSSAETVVFVLLGVAVIQGQHVWNTWFVILTVLCCTFFRILCVVVLITICNRFRSQKLQMSDQTILSFGGLRGAVSFALVLSIDGSTIKQKNMFVTTTFVIIFFTVFLQGILVKPLLKCFKVKLREKRHLTMNERIGERVIDHIMAGFEDISGKGGNYNTLAKFRRFNKRFIEPFLLRDRKKTERKLTETYSEVMLKDAMDLLYCLNNGKPSNEKDTDCSTGKKDYYNSIRLLNILKKSTKIFSDHTSPGRRNKAFTPDVQLCFPNSESLMKNIDRRRRLNSV